MAAHGAMFPWEAFLDLLWALSTPGHPHPLTYLLLVSLAVGGGNCCNVLPGLQHPCAFSLLKIFCRGGEIMKGCCYQSSAFWCFPLPPARGRMSHFSHRNGTTAAEPAAAIPFLRVEAEKGGARGSFSPMAEGAAPNFAPSSPPPCLHLWCRL